jgi:hypothetical protein
MNKIEFLFTITDGKYPDTHLIMFTSHTYCRPTRWDEWIVFTSPRLAPFRTRTSNITVNTSCPAPANTVAHAPPTGRDDIRTLIPELNRLILAIQPVLSAATVLCEEVTDRTIIS